MYILLNSAIGGTGNVESHILHLHFMPQMTKTRKSFRTLRQDFTHITARFYEWIDKLPNKLTNYESRNRHRFTEQI